MMIRFILTILVCFVTISVFSQDKLPTVGVDEYNEWQNLSSPMISNDGSWVAYRVTLNEGDDTLHIQSASSDLHYKFPLASNLQFSSDSKWAAFRIGYSEKQLEKMREKKTPIQNKMKLLNLESGEKELFEGVSSFSMSEGAHHVIMESYSPKDSKTKSKDIVVKNLKTGYNRTIGNVTEWSMNKKGNWLAYVVTTEAKQGNTVELFNLMTYQLKILASDTTKFVKLNWEKEADALAFLQTFSDTSFEESNHRILAFKDVNGEMQQFTFDPSDNEDFPTQMRVKEGYAPKWSKDLSHVFIGIDSWSIKAENSEKKSKKDDGEKTSDMEIWHWKDDPIIPRQRVTLNRDKDFTYLSSWSVSNNKFTQLANDAFTNTSLTYLSGDQKKVINVDKTPYEPQFRLAHGDYYLVDLATGDREKILTHFPTNYFYQTSPDGNYALFFIDGHWQTIDLNTGRKTNLTEKVKSTFWNTRYDGPRDEKPPFGFGGWMKDDAQVLIYDEYDVWAMNPDGSGAKKLTSGKKSEIRYRFNRTDLETAYIDPDKPMIFSMFGDKTKYSGFLKIHEGQQEEFFGDKSRQSLRKAKDSDDFVFIERSYDDSPDLFVVNGSFKDATRMSHTNPQQEKYAWGKTELIDFKNTDGKKMQGVLHYPANYESGKKYPMITYIYEIRSNSKNNYIAPSNRRAYNLTHYVQNGYFVFQPDIVYKTNHPGESAVECVIPAVEKVIETGMIDEKKIGLMGHSWGGYQTAFLVTQTKLFSAAVAGAPLTNMISMYNSIYWNSGTPDQQIFETSQGRLREPYWDIMENYLDNSPLFQAKNITTPMLMTFGDKDGAVDYHQGIEMYTTMRRMQKPLIMLLYPGENHGLRKKENQIDYFEKVSHFFDHHLKKTPAEDWIENGQSLLMKEKKKKGKA